ARVNNIEAIKNMIMNDIGISILPKISVEKEVESGVLKYFPILNEKFLREFSLVYHKNKIFNNKIIDLINTLENLSGVC
ncbi:MAG: hypothetical protein JXM74_10000, partial [Fusobacteriaceae bacterium]|nr:hypothetical protein [Fusobacteriaceae bacterium]